MHVLERFNGLVKDVFLVDFFEDVGSDDGMEVDLHVFENQIYVFIIVRLEDIQQSDNVLVVGDVQFLQKHDLAKGSLGIGGVLRRVVRREEQGGRMDEGADIMYPVFLCAGNEGLHR